jgi:NADPH:quinone reductase-like Zn-dependent oxidoreductase
MKAALFRQFGGPEVLKYEEVATPQVRPGHVLIKVLASGVNRLEHYIREGSVLKDMALPHVLGSDAVGTIAQVGAGVRGFAIGERVLPMPGYPLDPDDAFEPISAAPSYAIGGIVRWGSYAEYLEVPARWVLRDDTKLTAEELATLPMVLVTGVRAVKTVGGVKTGDDVLVHAGASGTGSMSIQIAKALGARVATTVDSAEKGALAESLGADLVIDVRHSDFVAATKQWTHGKGVDVVIDNLGGDILARSLDAARVCGTVVAMGFVAGLEVRFHIRNFFFSHKRLLGTLMGDAADFHFGLSLVKRGKVRPLLDQALPLAEAARAHALIADNRVAGNLVLVP